LAGFCGHAAPGFTPKKSPHHAQVGGSGAVRRVNPDNPVVSDLPWHHLHAWRFLLEAGLMPTYGHMFLIRTAHESALLAYWLVEPGIDSATRLARAVAARADDYEERRNFEESIGAKARPAK
jgi:hypothetical protein